MKAKVFFLVSNSGVEVLAVVVEVRSFTRENEEFFLRKDKVKKMVE